MVNVRLQLKLRVGDDPPLEASRAPGHVAKCLLAGDGPDNVRIREEVSADEEGALADAIAVGVHVPRLGSRQPHVDGKPGESAPIRLVGRVQAHRETARADGEPRLHVAVVRRGDALELAVLHLVVPHFLDDKRTARDLMVDLKLELARPLRGTVALIHLDHDVRVLRVVDGDRPLLPVARVLP